MNLSVYIKKELAQQIDTLSKRLKVSKNSIINEALEQWVKNYECRAWPQKFFEFKPISDVPDFKALRQELKKN